MCSRFGLFIIAVLTGATAALGVVQRTIPTDFATFQLAAAWLSTQPQPCTADYDFAVNPGTYTGCCTLSAINTGTHTVRFHGTANGVILNATASGTRYGFLISQTPRVIVERLTVMSGDSAGIHFHSSPYGLVKRCSLYRSTPALHGVQCDSSREMVVESTKVVGTNIGVRFTASKRSQARFCVSTSYVIDADGFDFIYSDTSRLDSCKVRMPNNQGFGIWVNHSSGTAVKCCSVGSTTSGGYAQQGILIWRSNNVLVDSCTFRAYSASNAWGNVELDSASSGCRIVRCNIEGTTNKGVLLHAGCNNDTFDQCYVHNTGTNNIIATGPATGLVIANSYIAGWSGVNNASIDLTDQTNPSFYFNTIQGPYHPDTLLGNKYGIRATNTTGIRAKDNVIYVIAHGTGCYAYYLQTGSSFFPRGTNYNCLYCPSGGIATVNGTPYADSTAWRASGNDTNSVYRDPVFLARLYYIDYRDTSPCVNAGTPIPAFDYDYFGNDRHDTTPSLGAVETRPPAPAACQLVSPANGALNQPVNLTLTWRSVATADSYIVAAGTDSPPSSNVSRQRDTTYTCSGLDSATKYFWRVASRNRGGATASETRWFQTVPGRPGTFGLAAPANGAPDQPLDGSLFWHRSAGADSYRVYLDTVTPPVQVLASPLDTYQTYAGLQNGQDYYWQVRAINFSGTRDAGPWQFRTIVAAPGTFALLAPTDGALDQPTNVSLSWEVSARADSYVVYLDTSASPTQVISRQTDTGCSCSGLLPSETYYWKVTARNPGGDSTTATWSFSTLGDTTWTAQPPLPPGAKNKNIKDGAGLTSCVVPDANDFATTCVFALKGNNTCEFYRYNTLTGNWENAESIPAIGSSGKKKKVKKGGAIAQIDGKIYAVKGNNTLEFWEYQPTAKIQNPKSKIQNPYPWTQLPDVPPGAKNLKDGSGLASVRIGDTNFVYLLKGSGTQEFCRYGVSSPTGGWTVLPPAPGGTSGKAFKTGSSIVHYPDDKDGPGRLFALKGSVNEFFCYDLGSGIWTSKAPMPMIGRSGNKKKAKEGASLAFLNHRIYALKGGNTLEFWSYNADSDKWFQMGDLPIGGGKKVKGGGALSAANGKLYAFKGNNTTEFYQLEPARITCGSQPTANGSNVQGGLKPQASSFKLGVFPNPFTGSATIRYTLPEPGACRLSLYDVTGKLVSTLARGYHNAGGHDYRVEPYSMARGVHVLRLEAGGLSVTRKLIVE